MYAPIAIFVYNREDHIKRLVESLRSNALCRDSEVFIFSDGPKREADCSKVEAVRRYIRTLEDSDLFRTVTIEESPINRGLARSIISGVTKVIEQYGRVIVLEDDLVVSEHFLGFMNAALDRYENDPKIWSVSGFSREIPYLSNLNTDVYFSVRAQSWSWGTWADRWKKVDWEVKEYASFKRSWKLRRAFNAGGNDMSSMLDRQQCGAIDSWAIRFCFAQFCHQCYTVQPRLTFVQNGGQDGSGTNCNFVREYAALSAQSDWKLRDFCEDEEINRQLKITRKKVPMWKRAGSYVLFVVFKGRFYKRKK